MIIRYLSFVIACLLCVFVIELWFVIVFDLVGLLLWLLFPLLRLLVCSMLLCLFVTLFEYFVCVLLFGVWFGLDVCFVFVFCYLLLCLLLGV